MLGKIKFQIHWRLRELSKRICLLTNRVPVVVYTMGKVGSTSIYYALKQKLGWRVMFTHRMLQQNIDEYNALFMANGNKPHRSIIGKLIYKKKIQRNKPVKLISLVREPISKNISDFFQDFKIYTGIIIDEWDGTIEELTSIFLKQYPHHLTLNWYEKECFYATGIDVYNIPFDINSGYGIYKNKNIELLLLRVDLNDEFKCKIIAAFLGLRNFKLYRRNEAIGKKYTDMYKQFISSIELPKIYIDEMLESKYTSHFFDNQEIMETRNKWLEK